MTTKSASIPFDPFTLGRGVHSDPLNPNVCYNVTFWQGVKVVTEWCTIPELEYDITRCVWEGEVCNFNELDDCRRWLDSQVEDDDNFLERRRDWAPQHWFI